MDIEEQPPEFTCGIDEDRPTAVSTNFKNFNDPKLNIQKISDALVRNGFRLSATGIAKSGNRIEIEMPNESDRWQLLTKGLMYGNNHILFRDSTIDILPVTVIGFPMNITQDNFYKLMERYGNIHKHYEVIKQIGQFRIKNGNRVIHFTQLYAKLPKVITVNGKTVKLVYRHQQKYFSEDLANTIANAHGNNLTTTDAQGHTSTVKKHKTQADAKENTAKRTKTAKGSTVKAPKQKETTRAVNSDPHTTRDDHAKCSIEEKERQTARKARTKNQEQIEEEFHKTLQIAKEQGHYDDPFFQSQISHIYGEINSHPKRNLRKSERELLKDMTDLTDTVRFILRTYVRFSPPGITLQDIDNRANKLRKLYRQELEQDLDETSYETSSDEEMIE